MNLASIGFLVVGVLFAVYAYTFYILSEKKLPRFLKNYAYAYFALAAAFLFWSFTAFTKSSLNTSVLIGDTLLLVGSLFLLPVLFSTKKNIKIVSTIIGIILSIVFVYIRINYFPPVPYMSNGILIFNTQKTIVLILGLIFALIWLPANLSAAKEVTAGMGIQGMSLIYSFIYILSTISAILFISVRTIPMVITSFIILGLCFLMLLFSNYVISKVLENIPQKPKNI